MYELSELEKPKRPIALPVILENIPQDIQQKTRWILWQWEFREDSPGKFRWSKVPYSGRWHECDEHWHRAKSNDPETWTSLKEVLSRLKRFDGIGYLLGDGFTGIDLDKCRDPLTGEIKEQELRIIQELQSYTEISPSGTGVKILVKAEKPQGRCRVGNFEMYSQGRYFTITGHHLAGTPKIIEARQEEINLLHARMFPPVAKPSRNGKCRPSTEVNLDDEQILTIARQAKNADKFNKLWDGDWHSLGYPSQSEADEALVGMLAFWCGPHSDRIDTLFRRSGLYRDKWERLDYRERTIERVIDSQEEYYQCHDQELRGMERDIEEIVKPVEIAPAQIVKKDDFHNQPETQPAKKDGKDAFHFQRLAEQFLEESGQILLKYQEKLYVYRKDHYVEETELNDKLRQFLLRHKIPHNNNLVGNVVPIIGSMVFKSADDYPAMPFHIGMEAFPNNVIAYRNGLLDVEKHLAGDNTLLPHTPKWVSTICLPHDFDPDARCPSWESFLDQVFEGDQEKKNLLQEWFGYCLMHDTSQHKLMVLTGVPRSGKGTTMRVLEALVGAENAAGYNLHSLADKFGLHKLVGKLVAFIGEVNLANSRDKYRILETLNSIVGEDKVDVEEKFKPEGKSQKLPVRFVIACNDLPNFVDPSGALSARLLVLDYAISFEGREDRSLEQKLVAEVSGISNWALAGYARLRFNGTFTVPAQSQALVNEFRRENSDTYAFIQDCILVEGQLNPGNLGSIQFTDKSMSVSSKILEARYERWCMENNIEKPSLKWMCRNLKTILPKLREERRMVCGNRERYYFGIGVVEVANNQEVPATVPLASTEILTKAQVEEFFAKI